MYLADVVPGDALRRGLAGHRLEARQPWKVGQPHGTAAAAMPSPVRNITGCRNEMPLMIASSTTIQIIWPHPMAKAKNGAWRQRRRPMTATASDPTPKSPPRIKPGTKKSGKGLPAIMLKGSKDEVITDEVAALCEAV